MPDLHTNPNRPIAGVGSACCLYWVVVYVDDLVQVLCDLLGDLCQLVKVKVPAAATKQLSTLPQM